MQSNNQGVTNSLPNGGPSDLEQLKALLILCQAHGVTYYANNGLQLNIELVTPTYPSDPVSEQKADDDLLFFSTGSK